MSYRHDDLQDDDEIQTRPQHREVTLSTGTILALFFGLALLCGAFFGFGYNMGSKARPETVAATAPVPSPSADFTRFKPAPGSPAMLPVPANSATKDAGEATRIAGNPTSGIVVTPPRTAPAPHPAAEPVAESTTPPAARPAAPPASPHISAPVPEGPGNFVVQVAAVSHQEDAELLDNALHRKGYAVAVRTEPQDKLFHIQVGPFPTKKDAETMRQRLLTDGYNAIVK